MGRRSDLLWCSAPQHNTTQHNNLAILLWKLNIFLISSSRELRKQKKKIVSHEKSRLVENGLIDDIPVSTW